MRQQGGQSLESGIGKEVGCSPNRSYNSYSSASVREFWVPEVNSLLLPNVTVMAETNGKSCSKFLSSVQLVTSTSHRGVPGLSPGHPASDSSYLLTYILEGSK